MLPTILTSRRGKQKVVIITVVVNFTKTISERKGIHSSLFVSIIEVDLNEGKQEGSYSLLSLKLENFKTISNFLLATILDYYSLFLANDKNTRQTIMGEYYRSFILTFTFMAITMIILPSLSS